MDAQYLDAHKFLATLKEQNVEYTETLLNLMQYAVIEDVAPVVHAHWMDTFQAENGYYMGVCSHCYLPNVVSLYCGKCGAKMDGKEGE